MQNINIYTEMERHYSALAKLGALDGNYVKYLKKHAKFPLEFCHNVRMAKRQCLEQDYTPGIYAPVSMISQKICEFTQQKKEEILSEFLMTESQKISSDELSLCEFSYPSSTLSWLVL